MFAPPPPGGGGYGVFAPPPPGGGGSFGGLGVGGVVGLLIAVLAIGAGVAVAYHHKRRRAVAEALDHAKGARAFSLGGVLPGSGEEGIMFMNPLVDGSSDVEGGVGGVGGNGGLVESAAGEDSTSLLSESTNPLF